MCFWTLGVGATYRGAELTRLGAMTHGAEVFIVRLTWRRRDAYLGAIVYGAKLGATSYDAEVPAAFAHCQSVCRGLLYSKGKARVRPSLPASLSSVLTLACAACPSDSQEYVQSKGTVHPHALFTHMRHRRSTTSRCQKGV